MHKYTQLFQFPVTSKPFLTKKASLSADFFGMEVIFPMNKSQSNSLIKILSACSKPSSKGGGLSG
jgi:hypothetical protein